MVVSVRSTPLCARTALAQPSGPSAFRMSLQPVRAGLPAGTGGGGGTMVVGGGPTAPGWAGPFTTRSARYSRSCEAREFINGQGFN